MLPDDRTLEELEQTLYDTIQPFVTDFTTMEQLTNSSKSSKLARTIWTMLNAGGEIILAMHKSLASNPQDSLKPKKSFKISVALYTGYYHDYLTNKLDRLAPEFDEEEFDIQWIKQAYGLWKDKLAGLYLIDEDWPLLTIDKEIEGFGVLTGSEWLQVLNLYAEQKSQQIEALK